MVKKIIIWGLILLAAYFFYKKYMADTLEPFIERIQGNKGKVDLFQQKVPNYKVEE